MAPVTADVIAAAALAAAAATPPDGHGPPDLTPVAEAIVLAAGARWCVLGVAGRDHVAGDPPGATGMTGAAGAGGAASAAGADGAAGAAGAAGADAATSAVGAIGVEVSWGGEAVGSLRLDAPVALTEQLAAALGPVYANAEVATRLHERRRAAREYATEIGDVRWRAAAGMDTERRELERDLHDGAQHHLVSLGMTVALLEHALASGGDPGPWLDRLGEQLAAAERTLADTAAGVLPLTLVRSGLVPALAAEVGAEHLETADLAGRRFPAPVESAVWFTCLEAVNNARKHAPGATIAVSLRATARGLAFTVTDDGPGFTVGPAESGLHHMRARVEEVGGAAEIRSTPGAGTTVSGFVPI